MWQQIADQFQDNVKGRPDTLVVVALWPEGGAWEVDWNAGLSNVGCMQRMTQNIEPTAAAAIAQTFAAVAGHGVMANAAAEAVPRVIDGIFAVIKSRFAGREG